MLKNYALLLAILLLTSACGAVNSDVAYRDQPTYLELQKNPYLRQIVDWQGRLARENSTCANCEKLSTWQDRVNSKGWDTSTVRAIVAESKALTSYEIEIEDQWATPQEFAAKSYSGDCEDIAIFIMSNLRSLGYPYEVRVLAVKTNFEDHALVKIQMPDLSWQVFETVQTNAAADEIILTYTPIVEFDEKQIISHVTL
nr:hypothetical protein [Desulfobulbaceae bacterium]